MNPEVRVLAVGLLALVLSPAAASSQQPVPGDTLRHDSLARFTLDPIDVTVTRSATEISRLPFAVQVVTDADMGAGRARLGLDEALVGVPGVLAANRQSYSLDQTLSIRGFGARSAFGVRGLKVLLDGVPQTLPDGQGQLTNVDLDEVRRVEVLRGSSSSLYGNAAGGVISLSTDGDRPARLAPAVRVLGGAFGMRKYRASVELPVGTGALSLSGLRTTTDGFRAHSNADIRQGRARIKLPIGGNTVTVTAQVADNPVIKDPGALTLDEMNSSPASANPLSVTRDAGKALNQSQAGITLSRHLSSGATATATVFGLRRGLKNPTTATYIEIGRKAWGVRGSAGVPLSVGSRPVTLTAGADAQWQRDDRINMNVTRTALTRDQLEQVFEVGPFLQATVEPFRGVTLLAGGRYDGVRFAVDDHFQNDGDDSGIRTMSALSGSLGIAVHASEFLAPYANVSTSFETPTTTELANRPTGPGGFNPDLGPQKAVNWEAGLRGGAGNTSRSRLEYSVSLYRANVTGELIPFEVPGDPGRRFFRNSGSSRHEGVEAGASLAIGAVSFRGGYTWSHHTFLDYRTATTVFDGRDEPGVPAHYFKGVVTVRAGQNGWVAIEQAASSSFVVNDLNTARNPGWAATSLRTGFTVGVAGWTVLAFGGVENLFDKLYAASVQVNAANGRFYEPTPGRNAYFGVELRRQ